MRVVAQRVKRAEVRVGDERVAAIGPGLLLYAAFRRQDKEADLAWMAEKVVSLRVFEDDAGKMNRSALDIGASSWSCRSSPCTVTHAKDGGRASTWPRRPRRPGLSSRNSLTGFGPRGL